MREHSSQNNESTTETLMRMISDDPKVTFVCHAGSCDEAIKLVKARRKHKKKGESIKTDEKRDMPHDRAQYAKEIVLGSSLGNGEFLLNVMWVNKEVKHYHKLHPEILGVDVTHGANSEKRGLHRGCSKSIDLRNLPHVNSFMPSEQA